MFTDLSIRGRVCVVVFMLYIINRCLNYKSDMRGVYMHYINKCLNDNIEYMPIKTYGS